MWHIVRDSMVVFDYKFRDITDIPYTFSYLIRKRMQIDSWNELPKEKRPPEAIWDKPSELEEWFDRVFDSTAQTEFKINWDDNEVEK